jgi:hypothetical protein
MDRRRREDIATRHVGEDGETGEDRVAGDGGPEQSDAAVSRSERLLPPLLRLSGSEAPVCGVRSLHVSDDVHWISSDWLPVVVDYSRSSPCCPQVIRLIVDIEDVNEV